MITFSGLLLLLFTLMPWGVNQIYENRGAFLQDQRKSLVQDNSIQAESRETHSESKNVDRKLREKIVASAVKCLHAVKVAALVMKCKLHLLHR